MLQDRIRIGNLPGQKILFCSEQRVECDARDAFDFAHEAYERRNLRAATALPLQRGISAALDQLLGNGRGDRIEFVGSLDDSRYMLNERNAVCFELIAPLKIVCRYGLARECKSSWTLWRCCAKSPTV
jgi:hypothetical protein